MAEKRKLQAEIDKTLKRVEEGITDFDTLVEKAHDAITSSQKEKLEGELKREIKKLQRYRDQIKSWLSSSEIKDKRPLEESRRAIEKEMEKFKACEKLFKTKAFSKEGLAQQPKMDPMEAEREKHRKWIRAYIDKIVTAIDFKEAEIEVSKTATVDQERKSELEREVATFKWHTRKLEHVLRRLENETVEMSVLADLKDVLDCYMDTLTDLEGPTLPHDESLYAKLGLEDPAESFIQSPKDAEERSASVAPGAASDVQSGPDTASDASTKPSAWGQSAAPPASMTPFALAATSNADTKRTAVASLYDAPRSGDSPNRNYTLGATQAEAEALEHGSPSAKQSEYHGSPNSFNTAEASGAPVATKQTDQTGYQSMSPTTGMTSAPANEAASKRVGSPDVTGSLEEESNGEDMELLTRILDAASRNIPTMSQRRHFRYYQPKTPWTDLPPSFPTQPLSSFATAEFFANLDLDTLFFTFYHQQGTYQQYLAARELKKKAWCYHKKYLTWFQPQSGPMVQTERGPRGTYVYFDSETGWCSRVKNDFTFETCFLESEMPVPMSDEPASAATQNP